MGFFMSPIKLVDVLVNSKSINEQMKTHGSDWIFSNKGKKAYYRANTIAKRTELIYRYLIFRDDSTDTKSKKQTIAYIIASTMAGTSKEYGEYPNILDNEYNPLIDYVFSDDFDEFDDPDEYGEERQMVAALLAALHGEDDTELYLPFVGTYENLTPYEEDPELFLIERSIIFNFCGDKYLKYGVGPYSLNFSESEDK